MANVNDVARYILEKHGRSMSTMKLQKLVYYSQAWNLVWEERPLFDSPIEAWANGPVIRVLYNCHRSRFTAEPDMFPGDSSRLTADEKETIDVVLHAYGEFSGQQLSDLSHSERPWQEAREGVSPGESSTNEVSRDVMQEYYSALLLSGAAAL